MNDIQAPPQPKKPVKKNKFSAEEDQKLQELIKKYGLFDWESISEEMQTRTPRQCRDRWNYYLNPDVRTNQWTEEEEKLLLKKYEKYGPKWSKISKFFDNRTDVNIKNHYIVLERRKAKANIPRVPEDRRQLPFLTPMEPKPEIPEMRWLDNQFGIEF